jgi:phosphoglycerate dehydrogenase-like enzyme
VYSIGTEVKIQEIKASSEYTFLLLLSMFRNMKQIILNKNLDSWRVQEDFLRGYELYGKTVGIIGFGRNGKNMAKYCKAFGMNVFFYDPYYTSKNYIGHQCHSLKELCVKVDALILTVTSSKETKNLITSEILDLLKPGCIVINTSRGEVINQRDLIKYIKTTKIYFALDVLSNEGNFRNDSLELIKMSQTYKNLLITPHVAGLTFDSERKAMLIIMTILSRIC